MGCNGKKRTFIWFLAVVGTVCLAAVIAAILLLGTPRQTLYWNLDLTAYQSPEVSNLSLRPQQQDGTYRIRFAAEGETVELTATDPQLVNKIDSLQVMGLTVDKDGVITAVSEPEQFFVKLAYRDLIQSVEDGSILINSSIAFNGAQKTIPLAKDCKIYDTTGASVVPQVMDEVLIYGNRRGQATHIFVLQRMSEAKLYWRLDRSYSSKEKSTNREPDENGIYTISFAVDCQQTQLQCRDKDIVTQIDTPTATAGAMGLVLDEEGFITQVQDVYRAIRGQEVCDRYDVTALESGSFVATNMQPGDTYRRTFTGTLGQDCKIFNVSDTAQTEGEYADSLQLGDRITAYADSMGVVKYIFIHVRIVDSPVYFNITRKYKSSDTTREPDAEGWYVFDIACDGQLLKLKTQDKAVARSVDAYSARAMGLKLNGDVIEDVYGIACVTGNSALASGQYVCSIAGSVIATKASGGTRQAAVVMGADCKVYDVTGAPGTALGEETTLQLNDRVYIFGTADGQATHIFVTERKTDS